MLDNILWLISGSTLRAGIVVLLFANWTNAQSSLDKGTPAESKPGTSTVSTYAPDKLETVNLANGNLSMNVPLVSIGGRGSAAFTIALSYNSKLWSTQHEKEETGNDPGGAPLPYVHHYYAWYNQGSMESPNRIALDAGWSVSLGPALKTRQIYIDPHACTDGPNTCYKWMLTKLSLVMPDGAEVELRDRHTQGAPHYLGSATGGADRWRGRVWLAGDGSATTYVSDADNGVVNGQLNGWVFLANGTRIRMEMDTWGLTRFTKIIDRQGNFITVDYGNPAGGATYTDQLGRQVILSWNPPAPMTVTIKGYAGVPDRVVAINVARIGELDGSGIASNLRADFRSLPRPFISGDYQRTSQGDTDHTIVGPHTDLFLGSESHDAIDSHFAVTRVDLLDGRSLRFRYNQYGEVAEVVYPGGGVSQIDYQGFGTSMCEGIAPYVDTLDRKVTQRRLFTDGTTVDATWIYSGGTVQVRQGDQNGPLLSSETHYFLAVKAEYKVCRFVWQTGDVMADGTHYERWDNAREYRVERQTGAGMEVTVRQWEQRAPVVYLSEPNATYTQEQPANDPRVMWEETTLENGRKKRTEFAYDDFNNVTLIKEYDFGGTDGSIGLLVRQTVRNYATALNGYCYSNLNPLDSSCGTGVATDLTSIIHQPQLLLNESIRDAVGNQKAYAEFEYDNYVADTNHGPVTINSGMIQYDGTQFVPFAISNQPRGNATRLARWAGGSNYIYSFSKYDNAGNVIWTKDANGNITTASFADNFGNGSNPDGGASGPNGLTYAVPTLTTNALGHQLKVQFDYTRGVQTGVKDPNGVISKIEYDLLGRPTRQTAALNLAEQAITEITYPTAASNTATSNKQLDATRWLSSKTIADGFDRVITSLTAEDGLHASTANFSIRVDTVYDGFGRVKQVSNPYRPGAGESALYTTTVYDLAGRVTSVTTPDNAVVSTSYLGNAVTVADQTNRQRKSVTDALGRLKEVYEAPNDPNFNYLTSYDYDVLDNLIKVTQGSQQRFFLYDSLKRLIRARNPEQGTYSGLNLSDPLTGNSAWSIGYSYDNNANLLTKTDARNITTTYAYDALNRNTSADYSNTTISSPDVPDIVRFYDGATNGKGRFWYHYTGGNYSTGSNVEHTAIDSYDALGRPLVQRQLFKLNGTWSDTFQISRAYNRAGGVTSQTYPSGHSVTYNYDGAGRLADKDAQNLAFTGNLGDGVQRTYASGNTYTARGSLSMERFGTQTSLYHKLQYNIRGQLWDVRVSTGSDVNGSWNRGALQFFYESTLTHGASGPDNNGNVLKSSHYVPDAQGMVLGIPHQLYAYDSLNRLTSAAEYFISDFEPLTQTSLQSFSYDRYGNRTINAAQTWGTGINNKQFTVDANTNRLGVPNGQSGAMSYDSAGNLITDTYTGAGARNYDAENRMTQAWGGNNQWQYYTYNSDGQRTRRKINNQETWQVYGFDGELLAEYPADGAANNPTKEYGYRNGQLLVTADAPRTNVALAANGATASASSQVSTNYPAYSTINGDRRGLNWNNGGGWNDGTINTHPDWLQIDFNGSKTIDEINVITLQDNPATPAEPTESMTFTLYGLTGYSVQYWNGSAWTTVPGGTVSGNNKVWRKFTFAPITTTKIRVLTSSSPDAYSRITEVEAWGNEVAPARTNFALGGLTSASSTISANYPTFSTINGDRRGLNWNFGGGWNDATVNTHPDWLQIDFNSSKTIDEINVITLQDTPATPAEPTESMTFSLYGLTAYDVQYWNNATWVTIPGGSVTGNNKVWRKFSFSPITTSKIRVLTNASLEHYSRITEVEAYGPTESSASAGIKWLVPDHLGTPRIIVDQTGSLAGVKRHDYLPFGEELFTGTGGRTAAMGYSGDGVRQQFTQKERDIETGLDYFLARYYSSLQGRFTSPDEFAGGPDELYYFAEAASANPTFYADLTNPQALNKYQYTYNNPLRFVDPDGHEPTPDPEPQDPCSCALTPKQLAELKRDLEKLDEATSKPLYPITDTIGTSKPPTIGPIALPKDETVAPVPRVQPYEMARPIDDPDKKGHRKKHKKDHDKHTKPRPGDKQPPNYRPFRRPPPKPKPERKKPKPKRDPKPEIGPDGLPVKP